MYGARNNLDCPNPRALEDEPSFQKNQLVGRRGDKTQLINDLLTVPYKRSVLVQNFSNLCLLVLTDLFNTPPANCFILYSG